MTDTGRPYFVMELVRGIKITEYCDQNQLPTQERLRLFILVCQAIQHAHQKGIIHRDIKPADRQRVVAPPSSAPRGVTGPWDSIATNTAPASGLFEYNDTNTARLFALARFASADAFITVWETKKHYAFWRPITAIQEGENDGNLETMGDATWQPLIHTPNYPDQSSGANAITGAMTRSLALFFGTDWVTFESALRPLGGDDRDRGDEDDD